MRIYRTGLSLFLPALLFLAAGCHAVKNTSSAERSAQQLADQRILFLGNSITENGLYVSLVEYALTKHYPDRQFDIISIGLGSETVSCLTEPDHPYPRPCLEARLDRALQETEPSLVLACYGMNDGIYHPLEESRAAAYRRGVTDLVEKVRDAGAEIILLTPPPFDALSVPEKTVGADAPRFGWSHPYEGYDLVLAHYAEWLQTEAAGHRKVIDLHGAMNRRLRENRRDNAAFTFAPDGVHPDHNGHLFMAETILKNLDEQAALELRTDWPTIQKDPLFQTIHQQRRQRSEAWLKYIGYTRERTVREGDKPF